MGAATKFNAFVENLAEKVFNLGSDTLKVALNNAAPNSAHTQLSDITQIGAGTGYTSGGTAASISSSSQSAGTYKLVLADVVFTASGGNLGALRTATLYDDTATNDEFIEAWDYGSSITLADTETFTVDFDATNGVLQLA